VKRRRPIARRLARAVSLLATAINMRTLIGAASTYPLTCAEVIANGIPDHQRTGCWSSRRSPACAVPIT
jgi:hypothetical protein